MRRNLAALVLGLSLLPFAASAAPPLADYAIFSANGRAIIGAGSMVSFVPGAPIPVVGSGYPGTANPGVFMNGGASVQGDVRSMYNVNLQNGCSVTGTVYHSAGTTVSMGSGSSIGGEVIGDPELPVLPPASACASGGANHSVGNNQTLPLAPGPYGTIQLGGACQLNLTSGDYHFAQLRSGNGLKLNVDLSGGPLNVTVCGTGGYVDFGSVTTIITGGPTDPSVAAQMIRFEAHGVSPGGWSFEASGSSNWLGDVFTPNGGIHFGGSGCCSFWTGHFHAQGTVDLEHAVTGSLPVHVQQSATWGRLKTLYR